MRDERSCAAHRSSRTRSVTGSSRVGDAAQAADQAMQVHGGLGYSRHKPFEHIYRHHRRYRITEGAEEIQMRKVAQHLFGFGR